MAEGDVVHEVKLTDFAAGLLECVLAELETRNLEKPSYAALHWGAVPIWNVNGDSCGELWVSVQPGYPTESFPQLLEGNMRKMPRIAWTIQVGIARCVATVDEESDIEAPDEETMFAQFQRAADDAIAMRTAICACATGEDGAKNWSLGAYTPYGPEGGAGGGSWTLTVEV